MRHLICLAQCGHLMDSAVCNQVSFAGCVELVFHIGFPVISHDIWVTRPEIPSNVDSISYNSCHPEKRTIRFRERVELADRFAHLQLCKTGGIATKKDRQCAISLETTQLTEEHVRADGGDT